MRIAFVGIKRSYQTIEPGYRDSFNRYHLELPYYFAIPGNHVEIITTDYDDYEYGPRYVGSGTLVCSTEADYKKFSNTHFDVVVHWRKWYPEFYRQGAINVINCQDHSFSHEWLSNVRAAYSEGKLSGILCFPTWHKRNLQIETGLPEHVLFAGMTLGVDTDVYFPAKDKDPYQMLWASDPGRGLSQTLQVAFNLFRMNKKFRLHVCYPDYVKNVSPVVHPAIVWHGNVENGPKLRDLFNTTGILPYASTFKEPSSRAHRQAMAAGSLVLYPPDMGTPSELIENNRTGIVSNPVTWPGTISRLVESGEWEKIGQAARQYTISENWNVQAERFTNFFQRMLENR